MFKHLIRCRNHKFPLFYENEFIVQLFRWVLSHLNYIQGHYWYDIFDISTVCSKQYLSDTSKRYIQDGIYLIPDRCVPAHNRQIMAGN